MEHDLTVFSQEEIDHWMAVALKEAEKGAKVEEIPVGCVFVRQIQGKYEKVAGSHNLTNLYKNASRHCEVNCLYEMERTLTKQQISSCVLFVTVEPCIMCTFALNLVGIRQVFFGQYNDKFGGCGSLRKDNKFKVTGGIMQKQSLELIKSFYERGNQRIPEEMRNKSRKKIKIE